MSAHPAVTELKAASRTGSGPCPVCHLPRETNGCTTSWDTELHSGGISGKRGWHGSLFVRCRSFLDDRAELSERLNEYHQREGGDDGRE